MSVTMSSLILKLLQILTCNSEKVSETKYSKIQQYAIKQHIASLINLMNQSKDEQTFKQLQQVITQSLKLFLVNNPIKQDQNQFCSDMQYIVFLLNCKKNQLSSATKSILDLNYDYQLDFAIQFAMQQDNAKLSSNLDSLTMLLANKDIQSYTYQKLIIESLYSKNEDKMHSSIQIINGLVNCNTLGAYHQAILRFLEYSVIKAPANVNITNAEQCNKIVSEIRKLKCNGHQSNIATLGNKQIVERQQTENQHKIDYKVLTYKSSAVEQLQHQHSVGSYGSNNKKQDTERESNCQYAINQQDKTKLMRSQSAETYGNKPTNSENIQSLENNIQNQQQIEGKTDLNSQVSNSNELMQQSQLNNLSKLKLKEHNQQIQVSSNTPYNTKSRKSQKQHQFDNQYFPKDITSFNKSQNVVTPTKKDKGNTLICTTNNTFIVYVRPNQSVTNQKIKQMQRLIRSRLEYVKCDLHNFKKQECFKNKELCNSMIKDTSKQSQMQLNINQIEQNRKYDNNINSSYIYQLQNSLDPLKSLPNYLNNIKCFQEDLLLTNKFQYQRLVLLRQLHLGNFRCLCNYNQQDCQSLYPDQHKFWLINQSNFKFQSFLNGSSHIGNYNFIKEWKISLQFQRQAQQIFQKPLLHQVQVNKKLRLHQTITVIKERQYIQTYEESITTLPIKRLYEDKHCVQSKFSMPVKKLHIQNQGATFQKPEILFTAVSEKSSRIPQCQKISQKKSLSQCKTTQGTIGVIDSQYLIPQNCQISSYKKIQTQILKQNQHQNLQDTTFAYSYQKFKSEQQSHQKSYNQSPIFGTDLYSKQSTKQTDYEQQTQLNQQTQNLNNTKKQSDLINSSMFNQQSNEQLSSIHQDLSSSNIKPKLQISKNCKQMPYNNNNVNQDAIKSNNIVQTLGNQNQYTFPKMVYKIGLKRFRQKKNVPKNSMNVCKQQIPQYEQKEDIDTALYQLLIQGKTNIIQNQHKQSSNGILHSDLPISAQCTQRENSSSNLKSQNAFEKQEVQKQDKSTLSKGYLSQDTDNLDVDELGI